MIIVKITILLVMITAVYTWCVKAYLESNLAEAARYEFDDNYMPLYKTMVLILRILRLIGVFASVIWALFFR